MSQFLLSVHSVEGEILAESKEQVSRIFREESGRSVAALTRTVGDIDIAEDAVQAAAASPPRLAQRGADDRV